MRTPDNYDLEILNHIDDNPETTQADLATQLGVAVGSVNWYIKRLINKGYIKVTRMQRRRLRYLLTPQGFAEKSRLTKKYVQASLHWYRVTREDSQRLLAEVKSAGFNTVGIQADGDLAEIIYLTCLEAGIDVADPIDPSLPVLRIEDWQTVVDWPDSKKDTE